MKMFIKLIKSILFLPTPISINLWWNFGSILGVSLLIQIITGLFLSMHYCSNINMSFNSIIHIMHNVNYGWLMRLMHMNGASFYFLYMYMHIGRGLYYNSFIFTFPWMIGSIIFLLSMMTAFLGYVLPWGQMSLWGATVITNLLSAIPYLGNNIVIWLWGSFSVDNSTLNRFYTFHFILPFIIMILIILHLNFIHILGSSNPLGLSSDLYKISFHIYFSIKDLVGFLLILMMMIMLNLLYPYILGDPENFNMANTMITPIHIQPEWYFLFAYAILRSIPNKLGGVIALMLSVMMLMILPLFKFNLMKNFYPLNQYLYWMFINIFILLTWVGMKPIEYPYLMIGQILTFFYFLYFYLNMYYFMIWDKLLN